MMVPADQYVLEYQQLHFAFCSQQCRERFLQNPRLYIGLGSHKAPVQEGRRVVKQRRLKLDRPLTPEMAQQVIDAVSTMMGIQRIAIDGDHITLRYDLLQATEAQIEAELARTGAMLGRGWSEWLRRAFVQYLEDTELENLSEVPSSGDHCH
jgi:YHS domain-containing protein